MKLCIDCRHFKPEGADYNEPGCGLISYTDRVTGETMYAEARLERASHDSCGPDADKWEEVQEKPNQSILTWFSSILERF